jgi:hypothetical protein
MRVLYLRRVVYETRWIVLEIGCGGCKTDARPIGLYEQVGIVASRWPLVAIMCALGRHQMDILVFGRFNRGDPPYSCGPHVVLYVPGTMP